MSRVDRCRSLRDAFPLCRERLRQRQNRRLKLFNTEASRNEAVSSGREVGSDATFTMKDFASTRLHGANHSGSNKVETVVNAHETGIRPIDIASK